MPSVTFCWPPVVDEGLKYNLVDFKGNVFSLSAVVVKEHTAMWIAWKEYALSTRVRQASLHQRMRSQARPAGTQERVRGCQAPAQMTPSRTPSTPSHARSQARRTGGHASGARKAASCVRLRRFEGACSVSVGLVRLGFRWLFHVTFGTQCNLLSLFLNAFTHLDNADGAGRRCVGSGR